MNFVRRNERYFYAGCALLSLGGLALNAAGLSRRAPNGDAAILSTLIFLVQRFGIQGDDVVPAVCLLFAPAVIWGKRRIQGSDSLPIDIGIVLAGCLLCPLSFRFFGFLLRLPRFWSLFPHTEDWVSIPIMLVWFLLVGGLIFGLPAWMARRQIERSIQAGNLRTASRLALVIGFLPIIGTRVGVEARTRLRQLAK